MQMQLQNAAPVATDFGKNVHVTKHEKWCIGRHGQEGKFIAK
jgi:hypothetical protein